QGDVRKRSGANATGPGERRPLCCMWLIHAYFRRLRRLEERRIIPGYKSRVNITRAKIGDRASDRLLSSCRPWLFCESHQLIEVADPWLSVETASLLEPFVV